MIGLDRNAVALVAHDEQWLKLAAELCDQVRRICDGLLLDVQHVGSTAVPGLLAKPIIDLAASLRRADALPELIRELETIGYLYRGDAGDDGGHLFVWESAPDVRTIHLHIVEHDSAQWRNYLAFRQLLRQDAAVRERYAMLKQDLARQFPQARESYTNAKREFIAAALKMARTSQVHIRILIASDAAAFQALRLEALRDSPTAFTSSYEEEREVPIARVAERLTADANRCVFGAFEAGALVGTVGLLREHHRKLAHTAMIWGVYVTPAHRQRGIARRLLEEALERAASMPGVERVRLGVNAASSSATALYTALGFESFGLERGFMIVDGVSQDELHMVKTLPNCQ